ncbi:hypothetical protein EV175_002511 [Coemansia sp. RSA 1933]|nr:hypothetical protein EV175_002511 [Coemansia sp. RSA 1933]
MVKLISMLPAAAATIAVMASSAAADDGEDNNLLDVAATVTDMSDFEQAMSSQWASIFYQVNQDLNMAKYMDGSSAYSSAVWLYGTTQLPASYDPKWVSNYVSRAHELYAESETATSEESNTSTDSSSSSEKSSTAAPSVRALSVASLVAIASGIVAAATVVLF